MNVGVRRMFPIFRRPKCTATRGRDRRRNDMRRPSCSSLEKKDIAVLRIIQNSPWLHGTRGRKAEFYRSKIIQLTLSSAFIVKIPSDRRQRHAALQDHRKEAVPTGTLDDSVATHGLAEDGATLESSRAIYDLSSEEPAEGESENSHIQPRQRRRVEVNLHGKIENVGTIGGD
ncbi:hypothetical protein IW262DRAFT_1292976 [Armillaria fumosa]|nr:hypothetical protein IW262DRAFT_1292976 [Armillaria fumosa]